MIDDLDAPTRVRPLLMTVATTVLGLLPLLWEFGIGADVYARTAAPVVGKLWSRMFLKILVFPAAYVIWRRFQFHRGIGEISKKQPLLSSPELLSDEHKTAARR